MKTSDFWNALSFAYLTTYSYNRGEDGRYFALGNNGEWNRLFKSGKVMNPTAVEGKTYSAESAEAAELAAVFCIPVVDWAGDWMCWPIYRDSICFFSADGKLLTYVNVCLECSKVLEEGQEEIAGSEEFFEKIYEFFLKAGHGLESRANPDRTKSQEN